MTISAGMLPAARLVIGHIGDPMGQHDGEQDQHQDAADVDQHVHRRDEVSAEENIQAGDSHKRAQQGERRVNNIARERHHAGRHDGEQGN